MLNKQNHTLYRLHYKFYTSYDKTNALRENQTKAEPFRYESPLQTWNAL